LILLGLEEGFSDPFLNGIFDGHLFVDDPMNGGAGDAVSLGDLAEAVAVLAVPNDGFTVKIERSASDVAALELGAPHAGAHSLDDQVAFEFGDGADDDDDGAAKRATGVDLFAEADELDLQPVELVEHLKSMIV
jgi:hypothetical protein